MMRLRDGLEMIGTGVPGDKLRVGTPGQASMRRRKRAVAEAAFKEKEIKLGLRKKPFELNF